MFLSDEDSTKIDVVFHILDFVIHNACKDVGSSLACNKPKMKKRVSYKVAINEKALMINNRMVINFCIIFLKKPEGR